MEDTALNELNVSHIKLANGDEVVALVRSIEDASIFVESPLLINTMHSGEDRESFYFTEWMPMSESVVCINRSTVITHAECTDPFKEHYVRTALSFKERPTSSFTSEYPEDDVFGYDDEDMMEEMQTTTTKIVH
ncbi:MAG: hypothetical protein ACKVJK_10580 [Methylophagaceae bacterium]|jgi:hypothetical protein|tara:strand:+ start:30 stop:431 length:402 start_codon:yes stop_codon:yes gene_type:complete